MVEYVMPWTEFHINTLREHSEAISDGLTEWGAVAITLQDGGNQPIYEPPLDGNFPLWPQIILIGLFDHEQDVQPVQHYLNGQQAAGTITGFTSKTLADEDWERRCLDSFTPMHFGNNLWVCPSWQTPPEPDAVNIIVDPGLAFGTGTHATTALCLEWLAENIKGQEAILDYGCGSGILAIAALKLGAECAWAVDYDIRALAATEENAARNELSPGKLTTCLPEALPEQDFDVLIANILTAPLLNLVQTFAQRVKMGGKIILSGILSGQEEEIVAAYSPHFSMQAPDFKGEWVRITGIRQKSCQFN
jgi:ribosomal protein L11 methyltransferase